MTLQVRRQLPLRTPWMCRLCVMPLVEPGASGEVQPLDTLRNPCSTYPLPV